MGDLVRFVEGYIASRLVARRFKWPLVDGGWTSVLAILDMRSCVDVSWIEADDQKIFMSRLVGRHKTACLSAVFSSLHLFSVEQSVDFSCLSMQTGEPAKRGQGEGPRIAANSETVALP